jgi:hypothetical protein
VWSLTVKVSTVTTKAKPKQHQTTKTHLIKRSVVHGVKKTTLQQEKKLTDPNSLNSHIVKAHNGTSNKITNTNTLTKPKPTTQHKTFYF